MNKPELPSIPVFKLYGESLDWPTPDLLHCETISSRSREHQWEIKPHRHADLCQLLFVFKGQAELEIEGQRTQLETPAIQVLPPLSVHGFRFSEDVEGFIVTLATPLIHHLQAQLGDAVHALAQAHAYSAGNDGDYLNSLFSALQAEYNGHQPAREMLMHALVSVIMVWVSRQAIVRHKASQRPQRQREYLNGFIQLVEETYRQHVKVEDLAHRLGISVSHLNGTCRELAGQPALQIMHERQLLEAKRLLTYTSMTIYEMSELLGFSDPTNFTRLFRRRVGISPKAFRDRLKAEQ
ncbi:MULTISPECIES: helix-turn-helix domain-containing protein [Pseudomonas]|jgi:AraC family transcriptional activator of pobA|uniref:AraC family transcriptional regulator n=4 Tax=Pseudomonas TaxID=286 RepID=A0A370SVP9_PSEJE|nr:MULTISPECIES: helix-turn-helix domain-containing protein [Pseudomonas]MBP5947518.1 helix-turn-helix domain-containing protein [Pseudomonas sp. P9(2020)]MBP5949882.1 helix-turn-helix domain-containing protein [Pseudomonas sp. P42]MBP5955338.1 helix-turn-helix domain-containing protein [Pseudomonas anatoliensis]MBZ9565671.1 helix-turn-helix domain-containing protein [Pseudomonas sp. P116]MCT8947183.1 helix-turn-helix domain-containing protein [Pseudomonas iridis]